jgi:hypothetical protein
MYDPTLTAERTFDLIRGWEDTCYFSQENKVEVDFMNYISNRSER